MDIYSGFDPDPSFPAGEVERCIRDALSDQADVQDAVRPRSTSAYEPEIDSLVVLEIVCAVEEAIGVRLPPSFVPRGGYRDVADCVRDVVAQARAVWPSLVKEEEHHE